MILILWNEFNSQNEHIRLLAAMGGMCACTWNRMEIAKWARIVSVCGQHIPHNSRKIYHVMNLRCNGTWLPACQLSSFSYIFSGFLSHAHSCSVLLNSVSIFIDHFFQINFFFVWCAWRTLRLLWLKRDLCEPQCTWLETRSSCVCARLRVYVLDAVSHISYGAGLRWSATI